MKHKIKEQQHGYAELFAHNLHISRTAINYNLPTLSLGFKLCTALTLIVKITMSEGKTMTFNLGKA